MIQRSFLFFFLIFLTFCPAPVTGADKPLLEDIRFTRHSVNEEHITFQLNGPHLPKIFAIKGEKPRVVFDFLNTGSKLATNSINTEGTFIKKIRIGLHYEPVSKTRVVLDLQQGQKTDFKQDFDNKNNTLLIRVFKEGTEPDLPKAVAPKKEDSRKNEKAKKEQSGEVQPVPAPLAKKEDSKADVVSAKRTPVEEVTDKESVPPPVQKPESTQETIEKEPTESPFLTSIEFDKNSARGEMVLFKLNDFYPPIVFGIEEGLPRVVCDFTNTSAAKGIKETTKIDGKYVRMIRVGRHTNPNKVRVVLDLSPNNNYDLQQVFFKEDNLFVLIVNTVENTAPNKESKDSSPTKTEDKKS